MARKKLSLVGLQSPKFDRSLAIRFRDAPRRRVAQPGRQKSTAPVQEAARASARTFHFQTA